MLLSLSWCLSVEEGSVSAEWVRVTILIVCCGVYGRAAGLLIDFVTPYLMEV